MGRKSNVGEQAPPPKPDVDVLRKAKGVTVVRKQKVKLTAKLARQFTGELDEFQGERHPRPTHVNRLAVAMQRGTFRPEWVQLATVTLNGHKYRVNGQHTCWARLVFEDDKRYDFEVDLVEYKADTEEALQLIYSVIDQGLPRGRGQVVMAQLVGYRDWQAVSNSAIKWVAQGFPLYHYPKPADRRASDTLEHTQLLKTDFMDLGVQVGTFLSDGSLGGGKLNRHIQRGSVVAAMLGTFEANPETAHEFWKSVADTSIGFKIKQDPRRALRDLLMATSRGQKAGKQYSAEELFRMCIYAWNAWMKGERRSVLKPGTGQRPSIRRRRENQ